MTPEEIKSLGSSTLHEALGGDWSLSYDLKPVFEGAALAGSAYPVKCAPGDNLALHVAVHKAEPGDVLVVDAGSVEAGYWGEVMTRAAMQRSIAGLVIDGGVRDVDALRLLRFPVFARHVRMNGTVKSAVPSVGKPITLNGRVISPGDLVVADADGIVCIPKQLREIALELAVKRAFDEATLIKRIAGGETTLDILRSLNAADI
jgi:4-hydroxy-4-methyl-2-oxoglutarate aldolase